MTTLSTADTQLHYLCEGQGETLVMIHGLGANLAFWYMGIAKELATRYRVITYDLRGHGRSRMAQSGYSLRAMAGDLDALLDHLGVARAHIVGHSFGARVALAYTIRRPERVASLTVADTQISCLQAPVRLRDWPYWHVWKQQLIEQGHDTLPGDDEVINYRLLASFNRLSRQGDITRGCQGPSLRNRDMGRKGAESWERLMRTTNAAAEFDNDAEITISALQRITAPTLVMYGEYSHCLQTCWALQNLIPGSHVTLVPGAGHFHPAVKPRRFVATLQGFLKQVAWQETPRSYEPMRPAERRGRAPFLRRLYNQRMQ